ncbi:ABC transporter substrate-binding protein [Streptomyces albidoflavus]|uniref:ABC transporter substrate-binding protein n=1 Tax=Streptomyces albidoflavus TaxID=1886 RepID=UPI00101F640E|nr:branched-chain amino acid ABC transporter substrate-binding protein [Streptomyces albidoflavus]RZE12141.1 branched-chain amino acid ABC transporter substrate-binding protein [Streptomyces albidoflavus]
MRRIEWPLHLVIRTVVGVVAAGVLAVAGVVAWNWWQESRATCHEDVVRRGPHDECVGVTAGDHVFAPHLEDVQKLIAKENARVEAESDENPYVSVAYLTSFTLTDDDSNSEDSVRHELMGAYLAQHRHNRGDLPGSPKMRLLVANSGSDSAQWEYTVDRLLERRDGPDRLVAVAGLGPSTERNLAALKKLSENDVATVASIMTATNIKGIDGFVRVAPTNVDEAKAGAKYLKEKEFKTVAVVQDDASSNLYAATLAQAFREEYPDREHRLVGESISYDSSVSSAWEGELRYIPGRLCEAEPDAVYFAGRGRHLAHFLNALANRTRCTERDFTVLTGDDTTNLTPQQLVDAARTGVRVYYTGLAHEDMYQKTPYAVSKLSAGHFRDEEGLMETWFKDEARYDGQDIMGHDAVITAAQGIAMASAWQGQGKVTGPSVARMFHQMSGSEQVPGASGFLSFKKNGDPRDKAVPILRLTTKGDSVLIDVTSATGEVAREN